MTTLTAFLQDVSRKYGSRRALASRPRYRTEVWTYEQLWRASGRIGSELVSRGVAPGDRVVLWAPNSPRWVAGFFGCIRAGAIVVPLDVRSAPDFVRLVVEQTDPTLALLSAGQAASWGYSTPKALLDTLGEDTEDREFAGPPQTHDSIAEILYTSGTTGDPKGVMLTHGNILANAASVTPVIPDVPDLRLLSILPLSHMFEQTVGLMLPLQRGGSIYYPHTRQSTALFKALQNEQITAMLLVPQALQLFMDAIEREVAKSGRTASWQRLQRMATFLPLRQRRLLFHPVYTKLGGRLEFFVSGGAPLDPDLVRKWEMLGIRVFQGYGATETAPVITATPPDDPRPHTVGKPLPGVELRLADDQEILVRGANVSPGYWRNPEATSDAFQDGWYRTGDLGSLDADGYLHLRGRRKNMIVLPNGQNVYPEDIESVVHTMPGVVDAVVLGLPHGADVRIHAVLRLEPGVRAEDVVRAANERLAVHQRIAEHTVWEEDFPRTLTMKVQRQKVYQSIVSHVRPQSTGHTSGVESKTPARTIDRLVADAAQLPPEQITPDATLGNDLGLDSLGLVELLAAIEAETGVYVDESSVAPSLTVQELERLVGEPAAASPTQFPRWPISRPAITVRSWLQRPLFGLAGLVAPATVTGLEHLREVSPPVLLVANHSSHLDSPTVLRALPEAWRGRVALAAAADYFFTRGWLAILVGLFLNAFPFSRTAAVRPTLEHCAHLLDRSWSILLFPEGTRSTDGRIAEFRSGIGLLAVELQAPVIPIRLEGLDRILPKGRILPRRGTVRVTLGAPLRFCPGTDYGEAAREIEQVVRALSVDRSG